MAFLALGAVVLALTGAEALYADMGHFGKRPIRLAWFSLVLPALVLNYFGQGALLLDHPRSHRQPVLSSWCRAWLLYPMIVPGHGGHGDRLAGGDLRRVLDDARGDASSATRRAWKVRAYVARDVGPDLSAVGQPLAAGAGVDGVVLGFRSSDNLGAAYGIAVTGTMTITTILALIVRTSACGTGAA